MNKEDHKRLKSFISNFEVTDFELVEVPMYKSFSVMNYDLNPKEVFLEREFEQRVKMTIEAKALMKVIDVLEMFAYRDTNQATKEAFDNFLLIQRMSRTYDSNFT